MDDKPSMFDSVRLTEATLKGEESTAEQEGRLERERRQQAHELWRERFVLIGVTAALAVLFGYSLITISLPNSTVEAKRLAEQVLPAVATGLLGYFVGRRR